MVMVRTDPPADLQTAVDLQVMEHARNASPVPLKTQFMVLLKVALSE
jgi:hypothetical protein